MKLWVITQNGNDRIAIDNYYRKIVIGADFPFSIVTLIGKEEVTLGIYKTVDTADAVIKAMDYHLLKVCDKFANPSKYLKNSDVVFHYVSDVFFKMPPLGVEVNENEESDC